MESKSNFKNWILIIINIVIALAFIFLIGNMFIKNMDFVYIICMILIALLPLSNLYKYFKRINKK